MLPPLQKQEEVMPNHEHWEDLTADEKADLLRVEIDRITRDLAARLSRLANRVSAIEAGAGSKT